MTHDDLAQRGQVGAAILVVEEAGHAIVAALHDVLRDSGQIGMRKSRHLASVACPVSR